MNDKEAKMEVWFVPFAIIALFQPANAAVPKFTDHPIKQLTINESTLPGNFIYTFTATDKNGALPITYRLEERAEKWFEINSTTGETKVKKTIDREAMIATGMRNFHVYAKNSNNEEGVLKVYLTINDVNEPPLFSNLPNRVTISEDAVIGQKVFTVTAKDDDAGDNGKTELIIESGNVDGAFRIDAFSGEISVNKPLDYDHGIKYYILNITANNTLVKPFLVASGVLFINVTNANDLGFVFPKNVYEAQVLQGSAVGTLVDQVQAEDLDKLNEQPEYKILQASNTGDVFAVNSSSGEITVNGLLEIKNYTLIVQAKSKIYGAAVTLVNINVVTVLSKPFQTDVIEGEAGVDVYNLKSTESSFSITGASFTIASGDNGNHFSINTNMLKVGSQPLDRETRPEYTLQIQLEKAGVVKGIAVVTVKVLDINDNPPSFQQSYNVSVKENIEIGGDIVKVMAADPDQGLNGTVKYAIIGGNDQDQFRIDNTSGQITLAAQLDHEKIKLYNLTVQASDCGSPQMTTTTIVIIYVEDVNDNSPEFSTALTNVQISEDAVDGYIVMQLNASDADAQQNAKIVYSIESGADGHFEINPDNGEVTKTGALSHKLKPTYTIVVKAKDSGVSPLSSRIVLMVNVIVSAVNLHPPVFASSLYLGGVFKDTSDLTLVVTVNAMDSDSGSNGEVEYSLQSKSNNEGLFFLEKNTGKLMTSGSFTEKEGERYSLSLQAKDKGSVPKVSDSNTFITIFVLRETHSIAIQSGVSQETLLSNLQEFKIALDDLTDGKAFIKTVRQGNDVNSTMVIFNVMDLSSKTEKRKKREVTDTKMTEKTLSEVSQTLNSESKQALIKDKYKKWKIIIIGKPPTTSAFTAEAATGLSAVVGAMICFAVMIGVGGIIMIIILLKKRREKERVCRAARVKFAEKPEYIEHPSNSIRTNNVENAQEAQEVIVHMSDETSSIASEEVQNSPDVLNYDNDAYENDRNIDEDEDDLGDVEQFFMDGDVNFGTFFPPPPTQPPPPIPETCQSSLNSEYASIAPDKDEDPHEHTQQEYLRAVLPPHGDFADAIHDYELLDHHESPTHSVTDSTTHLVDHASYQNSLLNDPSFGLGGALRPSINEDLSTEL